MPLRHSKASKWAAEQKKLKDQRPNSENRIRMNSQEEIDALADLIIQVERGRQLRRSRNDSRGSDRVTAGRTTPIRK